MSWLLYALVASAGTVASPTTAAASEPEPANTAASEPESEVRATPKVEAVANPLPTLLVLPTKVRDLEAAWGQQITHELARLAAARGTHGVITASDLKELAGFIETEQQLGCERDSACLARIAELGVAAWILTSSIGWVGSELVLNVSLIDTQQASAVGRESLTAKDFPGLLGKAEAVVAALLGGEGEAKRYSFDGAEFSCAVLDLRANGVSPHVASNLTQILSTAIKTIEGAQVVSRDDITAMLDVQAQGQALGCDDIACMAELGGALGVDKLVVGTVGQLGKAYVISLRLIDIAAATVDNRVTESFTASAEQLIGAIRKAAYDLFGVEITEPGEIIMSVSEAEAEVFVDDERVGETPLPPVVGLVPGRHRVRVQKKICGAWRSYA